MEREGKRGWNGRNQVLVLCFAINGTESEWGSKEEENKSYAVRKLWMEKGLFIVLSIIGKSTAGWMLSLQASSAECHRTWRA